MEVYTKERLNQIIKKNVEEQLTDDILFMMEEFTDISTYQEIAKEYIKATSELACQLIYKLNKCNTCKWYKDKQVCGRCRNHNLYSEQL